VEPDWWAAQARPLRWLKQLAKQYGCPLVLAGDIFDRAVVDSRLINFASEELPYAYTVAGNHDLPYHNIQNLPESAYGTLIRTKRIVDIGDVVKLNVQGVSLALHGFYFGRPHEPCAKQADLDIAVVHHFIWTGKYGYTGVSDKYRLDCVLGGLKGYDYYIFGDNHIPFCTANLVNCGSFYRRAKGHEDFQPIVALVYKDRIDTIPIPVKDDIITFKESTKKEESNYDFTQFFQSLRDSEALVCDAEELLKMYMISREVRQDVKEAITVITS
jgi:DNA repair exonuclease SbcCD nuclease subunit